MTDYFTHVHFDLPFTSEQVRWGQRLLAAMNDLHSSAFDGTEPDPQFADISELAIAVGRDANTASSPGFLIKLERDGSAAIHDDAGQPNIDTIARFVKTLMSEFDLQGKIGFKWSETANKSTTSAYGGGAFLISKDTIESFSASDWLEGRLHSQRLEKINEALRTWSFSSAPAAVIGSNLAIKRLSANVEDKFECGITLTTDRGACEGLFVVEFSMGTSIPEIARISVDGVDYGSSPIAPTSRRSAHQPAADHNEMEP